MPGPSVWPFLLALVTGGMFIGLVFTPKAAPVGVVLGFLAFLGWAWPKRDELDPGPRGKRDALGLPPEQVREHAVERAEVAR
jgi:hypothetical protein